jgi:agmatinase
MFDRTQLFGLPPADISEADVLILPLPLEKTVSYGTGTHTGPQAMLDSSVQIELFDEETHVDFAERPKLLALPPLAPEPTLTAERVPEYLDAVAEHVRGLPKKFLLSLGGEHTITYGVVSGLADPADVTVVQIDAHADLADKLGGRHWSHGTVMRRLWERGCRLVQIGIRSLSRPEYELVRTGQRIETYFAHRLGGQWDQLLASLARLEGKVYLTLDVDGLDPSIIPSTGTPQPNGLSWVQTMEILRAVASAPCQWIGADVVEFVASPNPPGCDLTAARLATKLLAWRATRGRRM